MSNVEFLREQLAELDSIMSEAGDTPSSATRSAMAGISQMRDRIEADIQVALRPALPRAACQIHPPTTEGAAIWVTLEDVDS